MKPFAIIVAILLAIAAVAGVYWVGQSGASQYLQKSNPNSKPPEVTRDDLVPPKHGPFGKVEVPEVEFNFGLRKTGSKDEHTFLVKNVGEGVLDLKMGKPTCQCTVGEITTNDGNTLSGPFKIGEQIRLKPNESANILVKWVMKTDTPKFRQSVPIVTTDPDQREVNLVVTGVVNHPIQVLPGYQWELGEMSATEPSKAEGLIYSGLFDEFTLTEEPRSNAFAKVTLKPTTFEEVAKPESEQKDLPDVPKVSLADAQVEFKSGYRVFVEVDPKVPVGLYREIIQFKVVGKQKKEDGSYLEDAEPSDEVVSITLAGRRPGPIEMRGTDDPTVKLNIVSNRVVMGTFPADKGKKVTVTLFSKGMDQDLEMASYETKSSIQVKFLGVGKVLGKTKSYLVEFEIPPGPPKREVENSAAEINLKFNHPASPDFKVLVDYNAVQ